MLDNFREEQIFHTDRGGGLKLLKFSTVRIYIFVNTYTYGYLNCGFMV